MTGHPDLVPDSAYGPRSVDQKGGPLDAHVFAPIHALLDPGAVLLTDLAFAVGGEDERQPVLFLEFVVRGDRILGNADYDGVGSAVIRKRIAKAAGLSGAARSVVLRIEIQHDLFAGEFGERNATIAVGRQGEIGGLSAEIDTHDALSPACSAVSRPECSAGSSIRRRYHFSTRAVAAVISASSRAKSTAPAQRARVAASGSGNVPCCDAGSPIKVSTACTWRRKAEASRSSCSASGGRIPASPSACNASAVARRRICGDAAASRSIKYWAINSRSVRPPGRFLRSHGEGRGCSEAMRRRMSATSVTRRRGSRGERRTASMVREIRQQRGAFP